MRITAFDSKNEDQKAMTDVVFAIRRNENRPVWSTNDGVYVAQITDTFPIGDVVLTVKATDADGVSLRTVNSCLIMP